MTGTTIIAPLSNFRSATPLQLGDDTEIHAFQPGLQNIIEDARKSLVLRQPAQFTHCLVIKNILRDKDSTKYARQRLEEAILRLRIFKPGSVGSSFSIVDHDGWYEKFVSTPLNIQAKLNISYELIGVFFYIVWERPGFPSTYDITSEDLSSLKSLFSIGAGKSLLNKSSFRFFFRGFHEPYATDRFLSNAIGLENLLVNDTSEQSNVKYKFVDRGCFLLSQAMTIPEHPQVYATRLSKIYDARSKIVHSRTAGGEDWETESEISLLKDAEDFLRCLLLFIIKNPELEDSNKIDKLKRELYVLKNNSNTA